ncbi:BEN domain-containing protein 2 [Urocitellus parryii]
MYYIDFRGRPTLTELTPLLGHVASGTHAARLLRSSRIGVTVFVPERIEGAVVPGEQAFSLMNRPANLKRYGANSVGLDFMPLQKRGRSSTPRENNMGSNVSGAFYDGNPRHQLRELQHYCEGLQELIENTNRQVNQLCGIISKMQQSWEKSPMQKCGNCSTSVPMENWANCAQEEPVGASNQPEACLELQQPDHQETSSLPRIVSTHSLQPCLLPESPLPGLTIVSCIFSGGVESTNNVMPPAQPDIAAPIAVLPPGETSMASSHVEMDYLAVVGNEGINPDATLPCVCIPPNFDMPGIEEASLENNPEIMNCPAVMGNDNDQHSSSPSNTIEKVVLIEMPGKAEANLDGNCQTIYYPALLGNITDSESASSSTPISSNLVIEKVILIEMPVNIEASLENNPEARSNSVSLENDEGQDHASSSLVIRPSCEISNQEETGLEKDPQVMNNPSLLENGSDQATSSSFCLPASIESGSEIGPETMNRPTLMENGSNQDNNAASPFMNSGFEYLAATFPNYDFSEYGKDWKYCLSDISSLIRYLHSEAKGTSVNTKTVDKNKDPANPNIPASANLNDGRNGDGGKGSSQLLQQITASETRDNGNSEQNRYFGNPSRNIQIPHSVMEVARAKPRPELSARYLIRNLFTEEVLIRSNVYGSVGRGMCALNPNRINALREFLQDNYKTCDLSETGYDWKLCVTAINSCIRSLRHDFKKSTAKSQKFPAVASSTESEQRDSDLTNSST